MKAFIGLSSRTPQRTLNLPRRSRKVQPEPKPEPKRTLLFPSFVLDHFNCECVDVTDIEGARTIVWKHNDGTIYHQDCSVVHPGNPGRSDFYIVSA